MLKSIKDKIVQLLEKNRNEISKEDYMRLQVYIDLLFDFAAGYKLIVK